MKLYCAYGLTLACERDLPFAASAAEAPADVIVKVALGGPRREPTSGLRRDLHRRGGGWSLRYANAEGGWLHFDHDEAAKTLTVAGSVRWEEAVPVLAGVACAVLLSSAGTPLLHGAAVALGEEAIAILAPSGGGKSTLAAALLQAGGRLLSEDLLVLDRTGAGFSVQPGHGCISLLGDAAEALGFAGKAGGAAGARSGTGKSWIRTTPAGAPAEAVALRGIYLLGPADPEHPAGRARRLSRTAAAPALVGHLYGAAWIRAPGQADLALCASLAAEMPVFGLSRAASLGDVEDCAAMLRAVQPASSIASS